MFTDIILLRRINDAITLPVGHCIHGSGMRPCMNMVYAPWYEGYEFGYHNHNVISALYSFFNCQVSFSRIWLSFVSAAIYVLPSKKVSDTIVIIIY